MRTAKIILLLAGSLFVSGPADAQYYLKHKLDAGIGPKYFGYNSDNGKVYCSNTDEFSVGIIKDYIYQFCDLSEMGYGPRQIAYNQLTKKVFVGTGTGNVFVVDGETDKVDTYLTPGMVSVNLAYDNAFNKLYANSSAYGLYVYDGTTYSTLSFFPGFEGNLYYFPGFKTYSAHGYDTLIGVFDGAEIGIKDTIGFSGIRSNSEMAGSPEMSKLYVALPTFNQVGIVDAATNQLVAKVAVGINPVALAYCPEYKRVYVACLGDNRLWMIDSLNVSSNIYVDDSVNAITYNPVSKHICFSDRNNAQIKMLDPATNSVVRVENLPIPNPTGLWADPKNGDIYAAMSLMDTTGMIAVYGFDPLAPIGADLYDVPPIIATDTLTVFWSPGTDQGGSGIAVYELYVQPGLSEPYANIYYPPDTSALLFLFSDKTMYRLMLVARDSAGNPLNTVYNWQDSVYVDFSYVPPVVASTNWQGGAYRLFSIPLKTADSSATILLGDDLGAYGPSNWRIFGYNSAAESFVERPYVFNGTGYWLASMRNATLDISGTENNFLAGFKLPLYAGWNLIGNPFTDQFYLSDIEVSSAVGWLPYTDSMSWTYVDPMMWYYTDNTTDLVNNGIWDTLTPLDTFAMWPWKGYAVFAPQACTLSLSVANKEGRKTLSNDAVKDIDWQLEISASWGTDADRGIKLGVSPQALEGYDRLDAAKPPLVSRRVNIYLPHDDWDRGSCRQYIYDFRPAGEYIEWPLAAEVPSDGSAELEFKLTGSLPQGYRLYLVDRSTNKATVLESGGRVGFSGCQEFAVIYTSGGLEGLSLKPLSFELNRTYPNPFTSRLTVNYQLSEPGHIGLMIYNISGQLVKTMADGTALPGYYSQVWNGRDDNGRSIASGVYIIRLVSGGQERTRKLVKIK